MAAAMAFSFALVSLGSFVLVAIIYRPSARRVTDLVAGVPLRLPRVDSHTPPHACQLSGRERAPGTSEPPLSVQRGRICIRAPAGAPLRPIYRTSSDARIARPSRPPPRAALLGRSSPPWRTLTSRFVQVALVGKLSGLRVPLLDSAYVAMPWAPSVIDLEPARTRRPPCAHVQRMLSDWVVPVSPSPSPPITPRAG